MGPDGYQAPLRAGRSARPGQPPGEAPGQPPGEAPGAAAGAPRLRLSTTETEMPPGCRVSCPPTVSRSLAVTVTVVLEPADSVPDGGDTVRPPIRPCDSVTDQFTGPFDAVRVSVAELPTLSRTDVGLTPSVPGGGDEDEEEAVAEAGGVVLAAGEFGPMVTLDDGSGVGVRPGDGGAPLFAEREALGEPDAATAPAEPTGPPDPPAVGDGEPPTPGPGEPGPTPPADPVGCGRWLCVPGALPDTAPVLLDADTWARAACPAWCPGPPLASATPMTVAATATATPPAVTCPCRVRHHGVFGGSSGLGNPVCPDNAVRCATIARCATASGVSLLASLSTAARIPAGMAAIGSAASGAMAEQQAPEPARLQLPLAADRAPLDVTVEPLAHQYGQLPVPALEHRAQGSAVLSPRAGHQQRAERGLKLIAGAGQQRVRVVARHPEHGRDLRDTEPLPHLQLDQVLVAGIQPADRGSQQSAQFRAARLAADVGRRTGHVGHRVQGGRGVRCGRAHTPVALVARHGVEPRPEPVLIT